MSKPVTRDEIAPIAKRIENAHLAFNENIRKLAGCTEEEAKRVACYYFKKKLVELDPIGGTIRVKHGAYLDKEILLIAVRKTAA